MSRRDTCILRRSPRVHRRYDQSSHGYCDYSGDITVRVAAVSGDEVGSG